MPQEMYGVWSQMIVTASLLSGLVLLGFQTAAVRFLAGTKDQQETRAMFHAMLSIVLINSFVVIILTFVFVQPLSHAMFGDARYFEFIPLFGCLLVSEALFELFIAFLRAQTAIPLLSFYYFLKTVSRTGLLALAIIVFHSDLLQALIYYVFFQTFLAVAIYVKDFWRKVGFSITLYSSRWKEIMFFSLPLVPYGIIIWTNNFVDRYFILHLLDVKQLSIYAVGYSLGAITGLFYSILGFTLYPHMAKCWNDGDKTGAANNLQRALEYYLFFACPFIALLTILYTPLVKILSTPEYISHWQVVLWLSAGVFVFGIHQFTMYPIILANKTAVNLKLSVAALIVNVALNVMLIPWAGITGAAVSKFISNCILAYGTMKISYKYLPCSFPWSTAIKTAFATVIMSIDVFIVAQVVEINSLWLLALTIAFAGGVYGSVDLLSRNSFLLKLFRNL